MSSRRTVPAKVAETGPTLRATLAVISSGEA